MLTQEELLEFSALETLLSDRFIFARLKKEDNATLGIMVDRYAILVDKIINKYKLLIPQ